MTQAAKCYKRTMWGLAPLCFAVALFNIFVKPRLGWSTQLSDYSSGFSVGLSAALLGLIFLLRRRQIDERFAEHSRKAMNLGGAAGVLLAIGLFDYHLIVDHIWKTELLAVAFTVVGVKMVAFLWFRMRD